MPTVSTNGIELYYETHGEGPALVFAHGVGGNHASWFQQVPFFSRWYQVITIDHRGFGNSKDVPDGPGRAAFVDDLAGLLDGLGIQQTALVAQSMGGWTMLGYTLRHPERVRALVMADTLGGITEPGPLAERQAKVAEATKDLPQLQRVVGAGYVKRNPVMGELYLQIASFNTANRFTIRGGDAQPPAPKDLAAVKVPTLFLVGQDDVLMPPDMIRMVHKAVPSSSFTVVPDAGHSVYFEAPEVFNYAVLNFLTAAGYPGTRVLS